MNIEELRLKIENLVKEINTISSKELVRFHQQAKVKEHMAITGKKGTRASLWIQPNKSVTEIDICPYGKLLEKEINDFMENLRGKPCDGYKQSKSKKSEPYWRIRIDDFYIVRKAAYRYAGLEKYIDNVFHDIKNILEQPNIENTEKENLIQIRIGQGKFRESVIKLWKGCSITGFKEASLLVASHIKPWNQSNNQERLDPYNGLLLLPNLDKAFDLGLISFDDVGNILISHELDDYSLLGINKKMRINIKDENKPYLKYHRSYVFKDKID
jgi:HNH endonuclease